MFGLRSKDQHMPQYPTVITLQNIHDHPIYAAAAMKHRDVGPKAIATLSRHMERGCTPPNALDRLHGELQAEHGANYIFAVSDRATCPDLAFCYR